MSTNSFESLYNSRYRAVLERWIERNYRTGAPRSLYAPIRYVLASGGKRIRPALVLLSCESVGGEIARALPAAAAIEILHNFTLVHDDIMDHANLRRGRPTIHVKWDMGVAILAGDLMVAHAYRMLLRSKTPRLRQVTEVFTTAFREVCEGQGLDKDYESRRTIDVDDYLLMISKKTGKVIASALEIGGLIGGGSGPQVKALRSFGEHLGIAFQLKDDLLDVTGSQKEFGKKIGGDIIEGKRTFLLIQALKRATGREKLLLEKVLDRKGSTALVKDVRAVYGRLGVFEDAKRQIENHTRRAQHELGKLPYRRSREMLRWLAERLLERSA